MKYYAVIDTNVVVSSMLKEESVPAQILNYVYDNTIIPLLNDEILKEYHEVLSRNKFDFTDENINEVLEKIKKDAIFLSRQATIEQFVDKDDIVFFEIVMSARNTMDAYLITGNKRHFPVLRCVVTPSEMLKIIEKDKKRESL